MEYHQPAPSSVFIPLYVIDAEGNQRLIHRSLELEHIQIAYPQARIIRNARGHAKRAQIGAAFAAAASHIGTIAGGKVRHDKLPSGRRCWSITRARVIHAHLP